MLRVSILLSEWIFYAVVDSLVTIEVFCTPFAMRCFYDANGMTGGQMARDSDASGYVKLSRHAEKHQLRQLKTLIWNSLDFLLIVAVYPYGLSEYKLRLLSPAPCDGVVLAGKYNVYCSEYIELGWS